MTRFRAPLIAVTLATAALATSCAEVVTDILEYGSIEVQATRRDGEPVEGAYLILYIGAQTRGAATTDAQGIHRFELVPPNVYGVYAEPPEGYQRPEILLGAPPPPSWITSRWRRERRRAWASST